MNQNEYEIRKKYCPAKQKNVIVKVYHTEGNPEECTEQSECLKDGGCQNQYLHSSDSSFQL